MRLVLDTNILISALLSRKGPPGQLLELWDEGAVYTLLSAEAQLDELLRASRYPKLRTRLNLSAVDEAVTAIRKLAMMVSDLPVLNISPDPNDNFILAIAQAGQADLLVTGDKRGLLDLVAHGNTRIVTAAAALARGKG